MFKTIYRWFVPFTIESITQPLKKVDAGLDLFMIENHEAIQQNNVAIDVLTLENNHREIEQARAGRISDKVADFLA